METVAQKVLIDGKPMALPINAESTFDKLMVAVKDKIVDDSYSITNVMLNGEDITGQNWERFTHLTFNDINKLDITTGDVKKIAFEMITSLHNFTDRLISELKRVAELFRLGDEMQGGEVYSQAIDGIQLVNHAAAMVERNLNNDTDSISGNGKSIAKQLSNLEPIITDMFSAQQDMDWVLLADLIEYELIPHLEERQNIMQTLKEECNCLNQVGP